MKAIVKGMWVDSPTINLDSYFPDDQENFSLWIELKIGPDTEDGINYYRILVCTPEWLSQNIWEPSWGRHMLIVREYDYPVIEKFVHDYVSQYTGDEWSEIAEKIARNLSWEFEDYRQA
jgi:hypothetical protein